VIGFALWCVIAALVIVIVPLSTPWAFVPIGAGLAVVAESMRLPRLDDNFVMNIVPLLGLTALAAVTGL